jgi:hypothetical protein
MKTKTVIIGVEVIYNQDCDSQTNKGAMKWTKYGFQTRTHRKLRKIAYHFIDLLEIFPWFLQNYNGIYRQNMLIAKTNLSHFLNGNVMY